ncbi:RNA methyltransferase [Spirochaetia bacterium]|nr:RNA methyltransferase [Spirochaetia bacterium]
MFTLGYAPASDDSVFQFFTHSKLSIPCEGEFCYTKKMRNRLTEELAVCGFNAALALGEYHPEKINRLFLRQDRLPAFSKICKYLAEKKHPYKICADDELERLCKSNRHQGVVAMIEEPVVESATPEDLSRWAAEGRTGLILHSVGNDHNLGAMVRSAAFFDAHFIILSSEDRDARLTTSAYRVAEGGMEHLIFRSVRNTAAFLKAASKQMVTIGADPRARRRVRDIGTIIADRAVRFKAGRPAIGLVVGNEETGLPDEVKALCSALVRIPGTGNIESLNVAQAATLFLHEMYEL